MYNTHACVCLFTHMSIHILIYKYIITVITGVLEEKEKVGENI